METNKDLLLKDLCGRLLYEVKVGTTDNDGSLDNIWNVLWYNTFTLDIKVVHEYEDANKIIDFSEARPYLFPLSTITEQQVKEIVNLVWPGVKCDVYLDIEEPEVEVEFNHGTNSFLLSEIDSWGYKAIDYLNAHHFDYRGLISIGLAIDATSLNIY